MQPTYAMIGTESHGAVVFSLPHGCGHDDIITALDNHSAVQFIDRSQIMAGGFIIVGVVRHPITRLVSFWRHAIMTETDVELAQIGFRYWMPFNEFLGVVISIPDVRSPLPIRSYSDEVMVANVKPFFTFRYEALADEWSRLEETFGWTNKGIKLTAERDHQVVLTRSQIAAIEFRYQRDFQNFNYAVEELPLNCGVVYDLDSD